MLHKSANMPPETPSSKGVEETTISPEARNAKLPRLPVADAGEPLVEISDRDALYRAAGLPR